MLRLLDLKAVYSSEEDDIYNSFYKPALKRSVLYRRAVGFFSLGTLLNAPSALSQIIENEGQVQLIVGKLVSVSDFEAIKQGDAIDWKPELDVPFESIIADHRGTLLEYRVRLLAWLFNQNRLEIKFAIRPQGLFHQKIGIFTDHEGDSIAFNGSLNDTNSALNPKYNSEEVSVFCPWKTGQNVYFKKHLATFEKLWSGQTDSHTIIAPLPEAIKSGLNFISSHFPDKPVGGSEEDKLVKSYFEANRSLQSSKPQIPASFKGRPFELRDHQRDALVAWAKNKYNGILELATGAGKTVTAIYGAVRTIEKNDGMILIIVAPYTDLADQWGEELTIFGINALKCYGSRNDWEPQLASYVSRNRLRQKEFLAIVVVNNTLKSQHFQDYVNQLEPTRLFLIGDECHHHSGEGFNDKLFSEARFRIGLSATPYDYLDDNKNDRLNAIYDKSVYQYTLGQAVEDGVLTPYEYHAIPVELTESETADYINLSEKISRAFIVSKNSDNAVASESLKMLLMKRARLIGSAENKMTVLKDLLNDTGGVKPYSLFYCGDGKTAISNNEDTDIVTTSLDEEIERKQRFEVYDIISNAGGRASPFTSSENKSDRREILNNFKNGKVDALVAIKCLDEGIDVPACRVAYLIASSRNPRQFIQRRGRILRRADNKDYAVVYDLVVVLPETVSGIESFGSDFLKNELKRVADFAQHSKFPNESLAKLSPWIEAYDLGHLAV